jgi:phosphotransferase system  glucose/maltose/N-acetylglucosamine-specific IIC component
LADVEIGYVSNLNMENALQILQTIGICVGAIALTVIAIFAFTLWITFFPVNSPEDEESESFPDEEERQEEKFYGRRKRSPRKR